MTNRTLLASALALAAFGAPAFAGNVTPVPLDPAPVFTPAPAPLYDWTGFFVGAQVGYGDVDADSANGSIDGDGEFYGLRAGYDYDFGTFVLGGIVQYDETNIDLSAGVEVDSVWRVGARAGFDSGRNLYYLTGGWANADVETVGDSDGYFIGAGYEVFLTERVTLGVEALYHEFDDFDAAPSVEADVTTVGLNVNFRF